MHRFSTSLAGYPFFELPGPAVPRPARLRECAGWGQAGRAGHRFRATALDAAADPGAPAESCPPTRLADSVATDSAEGDSGRCRARPSRQAGQEPVQAEEESFPLTAADSARWPVPGAPEPLPGAIIPEHRIVAFYGNPLSKRMGILGEIDPDEMLQRLEATAMEWAKADPDRKVLPALHLISVVAQGYPGPAQEVPAPDARQHRRAGGGLGRAEGLAPVPRYPARV